MSSSDILQQAASNATSSLPPEYGVVSSVSKISGMLSLVVWLFAQLPQVLENHLNQSVDGVSPAFLACWISGDVTNLIGCILTRALPFQTCLASYYCFIDVILSIQYWYYTKVYPKQEIHHNMLQSPNMMRPVKSAGSVKNMLQSRLNRFEASPKHRRRSSSERRPRRPRRSFLQSVLSGSVISSHFGKASAMPVDVEQEPNAAIPGKISNFVYSGLAIFWAHLRTLRYSAALVGTLSGWISTCFYVSSRAPQIWKNFRAKSTSGVSPFLFLFAMTGNILYTVSISSDLYLLAKYDEYMGTADFHTVLKAQMPFLIGSSGTVLFDAVLLFQFWLYKEANQTSNNISASSYSSSPTADVAKQVSPPRAHESRDLHFRKPDWYTNNFQHQPIISNSEFSYDDYHQPQTHNGVNLGPQPGEHTHLVHDPYIISPPRHYVVSSAQSSIGPKPTNHHRRGLSGTFNAFTKSFSNSPVMRSQSISSPGVFGPNSSLPGTAILPSIIGTYSSISKKMAHDSKVPFSPIDFLHDDFLHRSGNSTTDNRYMSN